MCYENGNECVQYYEPMTRSPTSDSENDCNYIITKLVKTPGNKLDRTKHLLHAATRVRNIAIMMGRPKQRQRERKRAAAASHKLDAFFLLKCKCTSKSNSGDELDASVSTAPENVKCRERANPAPVVPQDHFSNMNILKVNLTVLWPLLSLLLCHQTLEMYLYVASRVNSLSRRYVLSAGHQHDWKTCC